MSSKFQVIIPMTGNGSRFKNVGYKDLKPFINVLGRPIIEWIVKGMYSADDDFLFIIRKDHLKEYPDMKERLLKLAPHAQFCVIDEWNRKGPVFDILLAKDFISDTSPVIVNYCDFFMTWDWGKFKTDFMKRDARGAVPVYSDFHPHLIPKKNVYASCLIDEDSNLLEIKEKFSFSQNKFEASHSPGCYAFKTGAELKKYYAQSIEEDLSINGEFYASLPYNLMVREKAKVWVPQNVGLFCQWGTPEDLEEFLFWSKIVKGFSL